MLWGETISPPSVGITEGCRGYSDYPSDIPTILIQIFSEQPLELQPHPAEIQEQPHPRIKHLQIIQGLCQMEFVQQMDRLDFHENSTIDIELEIGIPAPLLFGFW
jgi:hypothetical protein